VRIGNTTFPRQYRFVVEGKPASVSELRKGMNVTGTKIVRASDRDFDRDCSDGQGPQVGVAAFTSETGGGGASRRLRPVCMARSTLDEGEGVPGTETERHLFNAHDIRISARGSRTQVRRRAACFVR
jgi:hypothetical protein